MEVVYSFPRQAVLIYPVIECGRAALGCNSSRPDKRS